MSEKSFRVGVVSITDPRSTGAAQIREQYIAKKHKELVDSLKGKGFEVIDPMPHFRPTWTDTYGLNKTQEVLECADYLNAHKIECLVLGCWHWSDSYLPIHLVIGTNVPVALYTESDPAWAGSVYVAAVSASLRETAPNRHSLVHKRVRGDKEELSKWVRGVSAQQKLRKASLMLWGGTYSLRMEHLQDDIPKLKSFLIGDILSEDQLTLTQRADIMLKDNHSRIDNFVKWLQNNSVNIVYDDRMLTQTAMKKQIALYLSARDRLDDLAGENIQGVSIKCQPEVSELWGATACFLPAFLPFALDSEGSRPILPTVCEGDIKGLLSCTLLNQIAPDCPPLFGDVKYIGDKFWVISNCGGASVFYADNSLDPTKSLPKTNIQGQCQGASGGAVGYFGKPTKLTLARLTRIAGKYQMQLAAGEVIPFDEEIHKQIKYGEMWPLTAIKMNTNFPLFFEIVGANHFSAIPGDYVSEVTYACKEAGIPITRVDDEGSMQNALEDIGR